MNPVVNQRDTWTAFATMQAAAFATATATTRASFPEESRLTADELRDVLLATRSLVVSTTRRDGRPHSALSSFTCHDGSFWLPASAGTVRARNVATNPYAALAITEGAVITAEGPADIVLDPPDSVLTSYARETAWVALWIRVRPNRLFSYRTRDPDADC